MCGARDSSAFATATPTCDLSTFSGESREVSSSVVEVGVIVGDAASCTRMWLGSIEGKDETSSLTRADCGDCDSGSIILKSINLSVSNTLPLLTHSRTWTLYTVLLRG